MPYSLAPGFDNEAGFVEMIDILVDARRLAHITSLGTYQTAREIDTLDGDVHDDGFITFTWTFEWLRPEEVAYMKTTFLSGERNGKVTVETRNEEGDFVQLNARLRLPKTYTLRGDNTYGPVVFTFNDGEEI
jgi:hypothetical protein